MNPTRVMIGETLQKFEREMQITVVAVMITRLASVTAPPGQAHYPFRIQIVTEKGQLVEI